MSAITTPCTDRAAVRRGIYDLKTHDIAAAIRALVAAENVQMNRPAVEAGLWLLEAGGDSAGGSARR